MINKHENIGVGVYWDDINIPGRKLSGWLNTRVAISSKNCEKYSRSTLGVAQYLRSYWDRRTNECCSVLLCVPVKQWGTYTAMHKYYHSNFSANKQNRDVQTHEQGGFAIHERNIIWNTSPMFQTYKPKDQQLPLLT
jgi:hypothetical protein